jgi:quercetin dioxygenase-like cupin family protein
VERIRFGPEAARAPKGPLLERATVAPLTAPLRAGGAVQCAVFRLDAGGAIRRHPAAVPQILAVIAGEGEVSGADGVFHPVAAGDAVHWAAGESHETRSATGLTAVVIEGPGVTPHRS